jgi:hypothetical protein
MTGERKVQHKKTGAPRAALLALLLGAFLFASMPRAQAQTAGSCPAAGVSCAAPGSTAAAVGSFSQDLYQALADATVELENFLYNGVVAFLKSEYIQVGWLEEQMISWWRTMWHYNLLPGMQAMTRQLNVHLGLQAAQVYSNADALIMTEIDRTLGNNAVEDHGITPGEQICVAATVAGGFTRADSFARAMRLSWEGETRNAGLNTQTDSAGAPLPGASSAAGGRRQLIEDFHKIFCDPNSNGGHAKCDPGVDPELANADVLPAKFIYNSLTIPASAADHGGDGGKAEKVGRAVRAVIDNMVGVPAADPMPKKALESVQGHELWLARRSYLARHAAIRSVPDMVASWRMPGSGMGAWVSDLRQSAGVPAAEISKNPSYKEILHAVSVDRFNSGIYAASLLTDENKIEMEKLNLSAFYLMQLRDYYELLERTALTLAVQVSILSESQAPQSSESFSSMSLTH